MRTTLVRALAACALGTVPWVALASCEPDAKEEAPLGRTGPSEEASSGNDAAVDADGGPITKPTFLVGGFVDVVSLDDRGDVAYYYTDGASVLHLAVIPWSGGTPVDLTSSAEWGKYGTGINPLPPIAVFPYGEEPGIAFYTANELNGLGTLHVWTRAKGVTQLPGHAYRNLPQILNGLTPKHRGFFYASGAGDGGLVDGSVQSVDVTFTTLDDPTRSAVIHDVNVVSPYCKPISKMSDDGRTVVLAYCEGTSPVAQLGRVAVARLDDAGPDAAILVTDTPPTAAVIPQGDVSTNRGATQLFALGLASLSPVTIEGRVIDVATGGVASLDPNVSSGFVYPNGASVVYVTAGSLKSAAPDGGAKTTLVASGYQRTLSTSSDGHGVAFRSTDGGLWLASTLEANQTPTFVDQADPFDIALTASGTEVAYTILSDAGLTMPYTASIDGGVARSMPFVGVFARIGGTPDGKILLSDNFRQKGPLLIYDVKLFDPKNPSATITLAEEVKGAIINGNRLAYTKAGAQSGLYVRTIP